MFCPNCGNSIRDNSNFCEKCGIPVKNQRSRRRTARIGTTWNKCKSLLHDYYRENKPGFFIIAVLLLAMLGAIGYLGYSVVRPGKLVVTVEKISREEHLHIFTKATLKVYCREFPGECAQRGEREIEKDIRITLPTILASVKTADAKITYKNNTSSPIFIKRFLYRTVPEPWQTAQTQARYAPKIERLRSVIQTAAGNIPLATKADFANTLALTENSGSFTILPGEEKMWRLGYNEKSEFQLEYIHDDKLYRTPVLRVR